MVFLYALQPEYNTEYVFVLVFCYYASSSCLLRVCVFPNPKTHRKKNEPKVEKVAPFE